MKPLQHALLVTIGTASFFCLSPLLSLLPITLAAQDTAQAQLPRSKGRSRKVPGSVPSGPRGDCKAAQKTTQTLLFQQQIGQTSSAQPTFLWHLSNDSIVDIQFVLKPLDMDAPAFEETFELPKAGFMALKLPADRKLIPGQRYRWSIMLMCDSTDQSKNPTAQGIVTYVEASPDLKRQLETATSATERAQIYAQQELGYEALATLWTAYHGKPKDPASWNAFLSVLEQIGHTDVVELEKARHLSSPAPRP